MQYAWLIWSGLLLIVWAVVYFLLRSKESKREMLVVSIWTSLLGLTEPIFVPVYWNPPSLFDLASRTGFDIESILFAFGVGGLAVALYEVVFKVRHVVMSAEERRSAPHRYHILSLLSAPVILGLLWIFVDINPIYSVFIASIGGGLATLYCRPDLKKKMLVSAFMFLGFYFVYFLALIAAYPGYVEQVWNFETISNIRFLGIPLEELMFALGFGFFWSGTYEHVAWRRIQPINDPFYEK